MSDAQIDAARMLLRALQRIEAGRKALQEQWRDWSRPEADANPTDRRKPPEVW